MKKILKERVQEAISLIESLNYEDYELGKHIVNDDFYFLIQEYDAKEENEAKYEAHKKYVDIQYIVEGKEIIYITPVSIMKPLAAYNEEKDVIHFEDVEVAAAAVLTSGGYAVLYPEDAHKPGVRAGKPGKVKKIVGKVKI